MVQNPPSSGTTGTLHDDTFSSNAEIASTTATSLFRRSTTDKNAASPSNFSTPKSDPNPWNQMTANTHHAIISCSIIGILIIIGIAFLFTRDRHRRRAQALANGVQPGTLPLYNLHARPIGAGRVGMGQGRAPVNPRVASPEGGDAAPPRYEEVVPAAHLRVAVGMVRMPHDGEDEEGMVADGKTPLSEIPFEDVVLEPSSSSSSTSSANRSFATMHHNGNGDTTGHTNT